MIRLTIKWYDGDENILLNSSRDFSTTITRRNLYDKNNVEVIIQQQIPGERIFECSSVYCNKEKLIDFRDRLYGRKVTA